MSDFLRKKLYVDIIYKIYQEYVKIMYIKYKKLN